MLIAPIPDTDSERLQVMRGYLCAYAPREERFDRITRTAKRLLEVPIALISIVEEDEQWFRSVQGLEVDHTPRDISFCGHAVALRQPLYIRDTLEDERFRDNPLVTGPPGIRAYLGWPLEIAPGIVAGTLCVIDTMPRFFGPSDYAAMEDLAHMAAAELKPTALSSLQTKLMMRLSVMQRKGALDPVTGCWNIRGFRELLMLGVIDARENNTELAVCSVRVQHLEQIAASVQFSNRDALQALIAQVLRQRLPTNGALARLGPDHYCALLPASSTAMLIDALASLTSPTATVDLPDRKVRLDIPLVICTVRLSELGRNADADMLWAHALALSAVT